MKATYALFLSLGVFIYNMVTTAARASEIDGKWYFTESRCVSVTGAEKLEPFGADESLVFDFVGEKGTGTATVRNAQGLCVIQFSLRVSIPKAVGPLASNHLILERQIRGDAPKGCAAHMTTDRSAYEFSFKQGAGMLALRETMPASRECRTRINYLSREPACGRKIEVAAK